MEKTLTSIKQSQYSFFYTKTKHLNISIPIKPVSVYKNDASRVGDTKKMGGIIETQVGEFSLGEAFAIGLSKSVSERILAPLVGNGTYMSGGVKIAGAWLLPKMLKGKMGKIIATGLVVDGVEDVINALSASFLGGFGNASTSVPMI